MADPAILAFGVAADRGVFGPRVERRRFAANEPEEGEESNDAQRDEQKPEVFLIHKASSRNSFLDGESNKAHMGCQEKA